MKTKVLLGIKRLLASVMILIMCLGSMNLTALAEDIDEVLDYSAMEETKEGEQIGNPDFEEFIEYLSEERNIDETQTISIYENEGLKYTFPLYSSWDTGYNASIRIDNNTEKIIDDWKIEMLYDGSVSSVWNAVIVSGDNGKYVIKNNDWNQDIYPGSYVEFGLSGQEGFNTFPTSYRMLNTMKSNSSEDYFVEYNVMYDWGAGFTGRITINNNSDTTIEDWVLEFDSENEISTVWDSVIVSEEGLHYVVKNPGYNQNIAVGASVSFGFNVNEKVSENEFSNYELKSYTEYVQEQEEEEIIPNPDEKEKEIPVLDEEETEDDYIIPEPANFDDCPEPGEFEGIGEAYVKEAIWEEVITDESGIQYVKNQILISAYMGADKEIFEEIAQEIGANIVGYIELTNDYQLEFTENKSFDELNTIIDYLNSYSFISAVTLNYGYEIEMEAETNDKLYCDNYYCWTKKEVYDYNKDGYHDINGTDYIDGTVFIDTLIDREVDHYKCYGDYDKYEEFTDIYRDDWDEIQPNGDNWGLEALNVLSAWDYEDSFSSVKVGVYDGGFTNKHEDLEYAAIAHNIDEDWILVEEDGDIVYKNIAMHGTHVAGILAAKHNNGKGISGVATNAQLYAYGRGESGLYTTEMVGSIMSDKLAYATLIGNHVKVINVSMGYGDIISFAASRGNKTVKNKVEKDALCMEEFFEKLIFSGYDFVICCAAGNTNDNYFNIDDSANYGYVKTDYAGELEI